MKSCIIFSCSIFDTTRLFVLHQFMQTFKKHYSDCDIYIGINPGSVPTVINIIDSYNLNTIIEHVPIHMYSESDASGYQSALHKLLSVIQSVINIFKSAPLQLSWFAIYGYDPDLDTINGNMPSK